MCACPFSLMQSANLFCSSGDFLAKIVFDLFVALQILWSSRAPRYTRFVVCGAYFVTMLKFSAHSLGHGANPRHLLLWSAAGVSDFVAKTTDFSDLEDEKNHQFFTIGFSQKESVLIHRPHLLWVLWRRFYCVVRTRPGTSIDNVITVQYEAKYLQYGKKKES